MCPHSELTVKKPIPQGLRALDPGSHLLTPLPNSRRFRLLHPSRVRDLIAHQTNFTWLQAHLSGATLVKRGGAPRMWSRMGFGLVPFELLTSKNPACLEIKVQPTAQVLPQILCFLLRVAPRSCLYRQGIFLTSLLMVPDRPRCHQLW